MPDLTMDFQGLSAVAVAGRSLALPAEYRLKRLPRSEKLMLCQQSPSAADLLERLALAG